MSSGGNALLDLAIIVPIVLLYCASLNMETGPICVQMQLLFFVLQGSSCFIVNNRAGNCKVLNFHRTLKTCPLSSPL